MEMDEAVWNHAVYSKNRERLLNEGSRSCFSAGAGTSPAIHVDEHFTVDGTLIEAWQSEEFPPKRWTGKPPNRRRC